MNIEYSVLRLGPRGLEPVGTAGNLPHVRNELRDWLRDAGETVALTIGWRVIGDWQFDFGVRPDDQDGAA